MKKQLVLASTLLFTLQVSAQNNVFKNGNKHSKGGKMMQAALNAQLVQSYSAQKPTVIKQRVIAQNMVSIEDGIMESDSFRYTYTGTKGSRYNHNQVGYNYGFNPIYPPMIGDYQESFNPFDLLADSIVNYIDEELYATEKAFYRPDNKIDSVQSFYEQPEIGKTLVKYHASGAPIERIGKSSFDNGQTFDVNDSTVFSYNNDFSKILAMNTYGISYFNSITYNYNTQNKVDTIINFAEYSGFEMSTRYIFDYYNDGRIRTVLTQSFDDFLTEWRTESLDSVGYAPGQDYYAYWRQSYDYDADINMYFDVYLTERFPGSNGQPDSVWMSALALNSSQWIKETRLKYEYNSSNNPVKIIADGYDEIGNLQNLGHMDFYYEDYDDGTTSVKNIADNSKFKAYPNPFQDNITIDWKGMLSNEKVMVKIVNILGQEVFSKSMTMNNGVNEIQVPDVNAGNYIMFIQDEHGKTYQDKLIKK